MRKGQLIYIWIIAFSAMLFIACNKQGKTHKNHDMAAMENKKNNDHEMIEVILNENDMIQANVKTDTVRYQSISGGLNLLGKVAIDENKVKIISARIPGRIVKLYFKNPGEMMKDGMPMFDIYSETLASAQQDYINLLSQKNNVDVKKFIRSAKEKLLLYGLTDGQLKKLESSRSAAPDITFYSPSGGYIYELNVKEGQYVDPGTILYKLADLTQLWVEAQLYAGEIKYLAHANEVSIRFENLQNRTFTGKLAYISPELENNTKINLVRYTISNLDNEIKPGMIAYLNLNKDEAKSLVIRKSALMKDNNMQVVWVYKRGGKFEQRMVETGNESAEFIEIKSGLEKGELVATSGAWLINGENILKTGAGKNKMNGMKM